ncbi:MAG: hypothetical protein ABIL11_05305 [Chloroflexota bacterium]
MSRPRPHSPARGEAHNSPEARKRFRETAWTIIVIALLVLIIGYSIVIQIIHHSS